MSGRKRSRHFRQLLRGPPAELAGRFSGCQTEGLSLHNTAAFNFMSVGDVGAPRIMTTFLPPPLTPTCVLQRAPPLRPKAACCCREYSRSKGTKYVAEQQKFFESESEYFINKWKFGSLPLINTRCGSAALRHFWSWMRSGAGLLESCGN